MNTRLRTIDEQSCIVLFWLIREKWWPIMLDRLGFWFLDSLQICNARPYILDAQPCMTFMMPWTSKTSHARLTHLCLKRVKVGIINIFNEWPCMNITHNLSQLYKGLKRWGNICGQIVHLCPSQTWKKSIFNEQPFKVYACHSWREPYALEFSHDSLYNTMNDRAWNMYDHAFEWRIWIVYCWDTNQGWLYLKSGSYGQGWLCTHTECLFI